MFFLKSEKNVKYVFSNIAYIFESYIYDAKKLTY